MLSNILKKMINQVAKLDLLFYYQGWFKVILLVYPIILVFICQTWLSAILCCGFYCFVSGMIIKYFKQKINLDSIKKSDTKILNYAVEIAIAKRQNQALIFMVLLVMGIISVLIFAQIPAYKFIVF